jgi:regulator of nucleoside diphosphate kinase
MRRLIVTEADFANLSLLEHAPLQSALVGATIVASDAVPPDVITMQSQVVINDRTTGERRLVTLVYPMEAHEDAGRISMVAPLGTALLGASAGQTVECDSPDGMRRLSIDDVVHQPERSLRTYLFIRSPAAARS